MVDILKTIKKINERLAVYDRQGLTESRYYKKIVEKIKLLNIPFWEKDGRIGISRKKEDMKNINVSDLLEVEAMPSLKQERAEAKRKGYRDSAEQSDYIINRGRLETWLDENVADLYPDARGGNKSAENLYEYVKDGLRKLDYDKIWSLIDEYEKEEKELQRLLAGSSFSVENKFNNGDEKFQ